MFILATLVYMFIQQKSRMSKEIIDKIQLSFLTLKVILMK